MNLKDNKKTRGSTEFYILTIFIFVSIIIIAFGYDTRSNLTYNVSSNDSINKALTCNKRICPIPGTNLCCNSTLITSKEFYCDIDNIVECD